MWLSGTYSTFCSGVNIKEKKAKMTSLENTTIYVRILNLKKVDVSKHWRFQKKKDFWNTWSEMPIFQFRMRGREAERREREVWELRLDCPLPPAQQKTLLCPAHGVVGRQKQHLASYSFKNLHIYSTLKAKSSFCWAMKWIILTKILIGASRGTTFRLPLGNRLPQMLCSRLWVIVLLSQPIRITYTLYI